MQKNKSNNLNTHELIVDAKSGVSDTFWISQFTKIANELWRIIPADSFLGKDFTQFCSTV